MQLDAIKIRRDLSDIIGWCADNFGMFAGTEGNSHAVLMWLFQFSGDEKSSSIDLCDPSSGLIISIDGEDGIIKDDDSGFRHYKNILNRI